MSERKKKTSIQWGKWALKSTVSYAVFILMGLLLSFVPAGQIDMDERVEFTFILLQPESCRVGKRIIRIRGRFIKETKDVHGISKKGPFSKTLRLPRTFPAEQEQALLRFLQNAMTQVG